MNADEILAIVEKFFEALKTIINKLKEVFAAISGGNAPAQDPSKENGSED